MRRFVPLFLILLAACDQLRYEFFGHRVEALGVCAGVCLFGWCVVNEFTESCGSATKRIDEFPRILRRNIRPGFAVAAKMGKYLPHKLNRGFRVLLHQFHKQPAGFS